MPYEIVIIGGGASGLLASVIIKEQLKDLVNVTILERLERVGKKLLATGSGKGNISNAKVSGDYYNQSDIVALSFEITYTRPYCASSSNSIIPTEKCLLP